MLQVGLVDDEKDFKVNGGDNDENENQNENEKDDDDVNNDFHFDVNVNDDSIYGHDLSSYFKPA